MIYDSGSRKEGSKLCGGGEDTGGSREEGSKLCGRGEDTEITLTQVKGVGIDNGSAHCRRVVIGGSRGEGRQEENLSLKRIFEAALPALEADRRSRALSVIRQAADRKRICSCPFFWENLRQQCGYMPKIYWLAQGILAAALAILLQRIDIRQPGSQDYLLWLSVAAALMGVVGVTEMGRHCSYHMMELEQSCYLNLGQLWTMNMILLGGVDILVLSVFAAAFSWKTGMGFMALGIYVLTPFVLSNLCCLFLLSASGGGTGRYSQLGMAAAMGILAAFPSVFPGAYRLNYLWVWMAALAFLTLLTAVQLRTLYGRLAKGEILCWN